MANVVRYSCRAGLCCLLLVWALPSMAQKLHHLQIVPVEKSAGFDTVVAGLTTTFATAQACRKYIDALPGQLQANGYLAASVDSVWETDQQTTIYLFLGEHYRINNISINPKDYLLLAAAGIKTSQHASITVDEYKRLQPSLLDYFENTGYPFASIRLKDIELGPGSASAELHIDRGRLYTIDSIHVAGTAKISRNFIHRYTGIERGSAYSRQKLEQVDRLLLNLPFVQQAQPWDVTMLNTAAILNMYLVPKKSNQVNVLAGFLPSNQQLGGKLLFTVDANLQLYNAFSSGEYLGIVWQQIQPQSPRLQLAYRQPYIFKSPFGIDVSFHLFKKDSSFLNLQTDVGILYNISAHQWAKLSLKSLRTNVLQVDTLAVKSGRRLPDVADVGSLNLGFDYSWVNTNYRFNPRSGNELSLNLLAGTKNIRRNNTITQLNDPDFNFNSLYDTLQLKSYQIKLRLDAARYFTLGKQAVLKTGVNLGLFESSHYFRNELFQIGGYKLLRGFDEESIFASHFGVASIEYRYLTGLNSYFFGFADAGWSRYQSLETAFSNSYLGAGFGMALETKSGIFNVSYAAGKRNDLPFNIRQSKIHIGYVSIF